MSIEQHDDDYVEDFMVNTGRGKKRVMTRRALYGVVILIAVGGFVVLAKYAQEFGEIPRDPSQLPVVSADPTPFKEKPLDPGGLEVPNQDKTVYDSIAGNRELPKVEQILPDPEAPIAKDTLLSAAEEVMAEEDLEAIEDASLETVADDVPVLTEADVPVVEEVEMAEGVEEEYNPLLDIENYPNLDMVDASEDEVVDEPIEETEITGTRREQILRELEAETGLDDEEAELLAEMQDDSPKHQVKSKPVYGIKEELEDLVAERDAAQESAKIQPEKEVKTTMDFLRKQEQVIEAKKKVLSESGYLAEREKDLAALEAGTSVIKKVASDEKKLKSWQIVKDPIFRVQLGAFKTESDALSAWELARTKYDVILKGMSSHIERADLGEKGIYYRLKAGPFGSESAARQACKKLREQKQGCFFVKDE